jgi:hypothetical protein
MHDITDELGTRRGGRKVALDKIRDRLSALAGLGGGGPPRARLAREQAQLTHDLADQFRAAALTLADQNGVDRRRRHGGGRGDRRLTGRAGATRDAAAHGSEGDSSELVAIAGLSLIHLHLHVQMTLRAQSDVCRR